MLIFKPIQYMYKKKTGECLIEWFEGFSDISLIFDVGKSKGKLDDLRLSFMAEFLFITAKTIFPERVFSILFY